MEKEVNLTKDGHELNFYQTVEVKSDSLLHKDLNLLLEAFISFWIDDLDLNTKKLSINVNLCSDSYIQEINSEHRGKDKSTDVLSFPLQDNIRGGEYDNFLPLIELGDLFVAKGVCGAQASEFDLSFEDEFLHLAVHGFLHVCGYDHEISLEEEKLMESFEKKIIKIISSLR